MRATGKLVLPADGPVSLTARKDLAEAAVAALTDTKLFDGVTPPLTAAKTLTFADVARIASATLGKDIAREEVSDEQYRQGALQRGFPEPMADMLISMFAAIRDGKLNIVDPTLGNVLGRKTNDFAAILAPWLADAEKPSGH